MGRSVSTPNNAEMVVFLQHNAQDEFEWDDFVEDIQFSLKNAFNSFSNTDRWLDRESHAILENDFGTVTINEYGGMAAISFVPIDYSAYNHEIVQQENLCYNWMNQINKRWNEIIQQHGTAYHMHGHMSNGVGVFIKA